MSGVKSTTVTINSTELTRLRTQAARAAALESQNALLNSQTDALIQNHNDLVRRMNTIEAHNQTTRQTAENFRTEVRQAVERAVKQSEEAARTARDEAQRARQEIRSAMINNAHAIEEANRRVEESVRRAEGRLSIAMRQQSRRVEEVRRSVDQISAGNAVLAEMAGELLTAANTIARNARDFPHGVQIAGGTQGMDDALRRAEESIRLTQQHPVNAPAARQTAADAFDQAQTFYQQVTAGEEMWELSTIAARQAVAAANARLQSVRTLPVEDVAEDGTPIRIEVDVDHWSDGALTALAGRLSALDDALGEAQTIEDLEDVRQAADRVAVEVTEAAAAANVAAHESQNRSETAEDFARSLSDHGMTLIDHGFRGGDKRGAHLIRMRDAVTGDEVVITQTPVYGLDGSITTRVEADLISDTLSAETFERRGRDMYETLGLGADDRHGQSEVQTLPGYETRPSDRPISALPISKQPAGMPVHDLDGAVRLMEG